MCPFRIEPDGRRVYVSEAELKRICGHMPTVMGHAVLDEKPRASAAKPITSFVSLKPSTPAKVDDRRQRATKLKARLAPLLRDADAALEQVRLQDIERSTQVGRAAIAQRLKAKYS